MRLRKLLDLVTKGITAPSITNAISSLLRKIAALFNWKRVCAYLLHLAPQQHHLHGTIFHRVIGERLFDPRIWKPTKESISGGLAIGLFIALTPTIGIQMFLSIMAAYLLRVNIPAAVVSCMITNPLTAPVIYPLQYKLGIWLIGIPRADELEEYSSRLRLFIRYAKPLWVGSLISATFCAVFVYVGVLVIWERIAKFIKNKLDIR